MGRCKELFLSIKKELPQYLGEVYERAAMDILQNNTERFFIPEAIGRWWDKDAEIDLVAVSKATNEILFGEVKWSNKKIGVNIYHELKEKAGKVAWGKKGRKEYFALFSKSGFTPDMLDMAKKEQVILLRRIKWSLVVKGRVHCPLPLALSSLLFMNSTNAINPITQKTFHFLLFTPHGVGWFQKKPDRAEPNRG
jgi:hypothetical protein